jgi:hypothetical protein
MVISLLAILSYCFVAWIISMPNPDMKTAAWDFALIPTILTILISVWLVGGRVSNWGNHND